ncbi:hypothetical protein BD626DRAFT_539086 [Schizophyllum amplum]|uniref:Uncharacterized protein n=1 Tax=Schizophyllum amplum TaxID=97359 RepID=A0A550C507_9AGAR|nr:hypothetical protein BD626DRAFT_539086 [Auriculariopsis ampla]
MSPSLEHVLEQASAHANMQTYATTTFPIPKKDALCSKLTAQIALNGAMLAPVRRLPAELLSDIFTLVIARKASYWVDNIYYRPAFAETCRSWRAVALTTPRLWNRMEMVHGMMTGRSPIVLEARLPLSGSLPLHLDIDGPLWKEPKIWLLLLSHAPRWGTLSWRGSPYDMFPSESLATKFPLLESISLTLKHDTMHSSLPPPIVSLDMFGLPCLAVVNVQIPQSWRLTHLSLDITSRSGNSADHTEVIICSVLQQCCTTLQSLKFYAPLSARPRNDILGLDFLPSLNLPCLTHLNIFGSIDWLPTRVRAPSLYHLELHRFPIRQSTPAILQQLARNSFAIERVEIELGYRRSGLEGLEDDMQLVQCLQAIPMVQHLVAMSSKGAYFERNPDMSIMNISFLEALTCSTDAPVLLPALESLVLDYAGIYPGTDRDAWDDEVPRDLRAAVQRMVLSRRTQQVVRGCTVAALKNFTTDMPGL